MDQAEQSLKTFQPLFVLKTFDVKSNAGRQPLPRQVPCCHVLLKEEISLSFEMTRRAENSLLAAPLVNQVATCVCAGVVSCKKGWRGVGGVVPRTDITTPHLLFSIFTKSDFDTSSKCH